MEDWAVIVAEHGLRVWRTAFRVLNRYADAQDCYQDTFLAAWQFAQGRKLEGWGLCSLAWPPARLSTA